MSDTSDKKVTKPSFDPSDLLSQLKRIVEGNKGPPATDGGGGSAKSWVSALIILAVVLVGIAIWSWISFRRGRELAKLRHEKNKTKILADQAKVDLKVKEGDEEIAELEKAIEVEDEKIRIVDADIRAEEGRYEADLRAIRSIRSWRDAGIR